MTVDQIKVPLAIEIKVFETKFKSSIKSTVPRQGHHDLWVLRL